MSTSSRLDLVVVLLALASRLADRELHLLDVVARADGVEERGRREVDRLHHRKSSTRAGPRSGFVMPQWKLTTSISPLCLSSTALAGDPVDLQEHVYRHALLLSRRASPGTRRAAPRTRRRLRPRARAPYRARPAKRPVPPSTAYARSAPRAPPAPIPNRVASPIRNVCISSGDADPDRDSERHLGGERGRDELAHRGGRRARRAARSAARPARRPGVFRAPRRSDAAPVKRSSPPAATGPSRAGALIARRRSAAGDERRRGPPPPRPPGAAASGAWTRAR